ncbi:hypothetical protein F3Y22_tig00112127pilonHSYRG00005 [Hibiscus syriacus]|uniref:RING-type E3 ubiquitin transferase n=1 Tax=Hibiscus syriacus TaxID=106335 RepID=A0A6A2XL42_HIBSY|nr:hypothetical protein F3Y22_tig00112127pilonHSYRG00005 [Hibiscus syriacus]
MKRLRQELEQTMDLYSNACREALTAKQQAMDMNRYKYKEEERQAEEAAMSAVEATKAAERLAEIEQATDNFAPSRKIGEGGYGPVCKCYLDHTQVAVKILRPDAAQGRLQFLQELQVLSRIRHPNMVLLLGACLDKAGDFAWRPQACQQITTKQDWQSCILPRVNEVANSGSPSSQDKGIK